MTMDHLKKIASGVVRSGVLTAGLFGLYYFHKRQIPEYMGIISFGVTCMGIYAMSAFILEDEYEESEEDKDKEPKLMRVKHVSLTPKPKMKPTRTRRILTRDDFQETDDDLENPSVKKQNLQEVEAEHSPTILKLSKSESKDKVQHEKKTLRFEEPAVKKENIIKHTSATEVKMPDIVKETSATDNSKTGIRLRFKENIDKQLAKSAPPSSTSEKTE